MPAPVHGRFQPGPEKRGGPHRPGGLRLGRLGGEALLLGAEPGGSQGCSLTACPLQVEKRRVSLPRVLSAPPVAGTVCHAYDREVHLRCELTPGYYLAVPSTFLKDVPGRFLLRVFSSGRVSLR